MAVVSVEVGAGQKAAALRELRQVQRELAERDLLRRSDALDGAQDAVERLGEIGSSAGILDRAAEVLGTHSGFGRVVVSQVAEARLVPHSIWIRNPLPNESMAELRHLEITLEYPLVEAEIAHRGGAAVAVTATGPRSPAVLRELLGWERYILAPLQLRGATIGLLHADPAPDGEPGAAVEREVAEIYAKGLTAAFERAVLREMLQRHREELRAAVAWMGDHVDNELAEAASTLGERPTGSDSPAEQLTRREAEVLDLLGRGQTNAAIAASLLISQSTVKFHVKNILLKLGATSRADAVGKHLRGN